MPRYFTIYDIKEVIYYKIDKSRDVNPVKAQLPYLRFLKNSLLKISSKQFWLIASQTVLSLLKK